MATNQKIKAVNPVTILKNHHRRKTFELLLKNKEVSKNDISKILHVSAQTAMKIIHYFEDYGLVECVGEKEVELGRKPQIYSLKKNKAFYIGIIHEGNSIHAGIVNLNLELLFDVTVEMKDTIEETLYNQTCEIVEYLIKETEKIISSKVTILGIGMGLPGVVNENTMEISMAPSFSIIDPFKIEPFIEKLKTKLNVEVVIENNVNAAILGEHKDESDLAYLSLGVGIGLGIILENKLRRGANFKAGEVGNLITSDINHTLEDLIGLQALCNRFNLNEKDISDCDKETRIKLIDFIATETVKVITTTIAILDINDFIIAGLTLDLLGDDLFFKIKEKIATLRNYNINLRKQSSSISPLIGICKKSSDFCIDRLLLLDKANAKKN